MSLMSWMNKSGAEENLPRRFFIASLYLVVGIGDLLRHFPILYR